MNLDVNSFLNVLFPALSAIIASLLTYFGTRKSNKTQIDSVYVENIKDILETYKADSKELKQEVDEYLNENHKLRESLVKVQEDNISLQDLYNEVIQTNNELIKKNNELIKINEEIKTENIKLRRSIDELNKKIKNSN